MCKLSNAHTPSPSYVACKFCLNMSRFVQTTLNDNSHVWASYKTATCMGISVSFFFANNSDHVVDSNKINRLAELVKRHVRAIFHGDQTVPSRNPECPARNQRGDLIPKIQNPDHISIGTKQPSIRRTSRIIQRRKRGCFRRKLYGSAQGTEWDKITVLT